MITILIVDDEKLERRGIRFLLKREGDFQILEAANGKDALGILASNHVDILFSDVKSAAYSIGKQVDRNLGKSEQEFMTDEFAIPEEKTEKPAKSKKSPER